MKRALRTKSVGTKVSEAELRVLESRAAAAGLTLSEWEIGGHDTYSPGTVLSSSVWLDWLAS